MTTHHKVLVTGATGRIGSATIRALVSLASERPDTSITIHALVRDASSGTARALAALSPSVNLFEGTFSDTGAITAAAEGCTALFLLSLPNPRDPDTEVSYAHNVLNVCTPNTGIKRAVYVSASIIGAHEAWAELDNWPGMAWYMRAKKNIEDAVLTAGFANGATVLRPAMFWSNFLGQGAWGMYPTLREKGEIRTALEHDHAVGCLDPEDVGRFAARALVELGDERWDNKIIPLSSAHMTMSEIATALTSAVNGRREVRVVQVRPEDVEERPVLMESELFRNRFRVVVDLDEVRGWGIRLGTWGEFVEREREGIEVALGVKGGGA